MCCVGSLLLLSMLMLSASNVAADSLFIKLGGIWSNIHQIRNVHFRSCRSHHSSHLLRLLHVPLLSLLLRLFS